MNARHGSACAARTGTTLIELLVVLAVLGVMLGVAGVAFHDMRVAPTEESTLLERVAATRRLAITTGLSQSATIVFDGRPRAVFAQPDGRVLVDSLPALDPLSGRTGTTNDDDADQ
jgi:prepilin-type N-terminal cleavage/methylation domain-containing protein